MAVHRSRRYAAGAALTLLAALLVPAPGAGGTAAPDDWAMFHHDARHAGVSADPTMSATAAPSLALQWEANTGQHTYSSPAVVWNATLGKSVVYQGSQSGIMSAYDAATGQRLWWYQAGASITSSAAVAGNVVYFGSDDHRLYAVDATTGAFRCKALLGGALNSSPVVADPDGHGQVVYIGDNGFSGSNDGGHVWAVNAVDPNPATNCTVRWSFDAFGDPAGSQPAAGSWSPPAFSLDRSGRPLVIFGSSSPDDSVYAVDARDGTLAWRFQTEVFTPEDEDVGAGPTVSPPGVNGFADGVVYAVGKDRIAYALNLGSGAKLWEFRIRDDDPDSGLTRSTPALLGRTLYLGYGSGVYALDAVTGTKVWQTPLETDPNLEVVSSPAVAGPAGDEVVVVGDLAGTVFALDAGDGHSVWSYRTGGFIYSSAAAAAGKLFIGSDDGFLYAFGFDGGPSARPLATLTSPTAGAFLPNPAGNLTLQGTASDDVAVQRVLVAVRSGSGAKWWDASTGKWTKAFTENRAQLTNPGARSTGWSFPYPVSSDGGEYYAQATAAASDGQSAAPVATVRFTVGSLGNPPGTTILSPVRKEVFPFPTSGRTSFPITVEGTATDLAGAHPGVAHVKVVVKNIEHDEYYCGGLGCAGGSSEFSAFTPRHTTVLATLSDPGATSTSWTLTFPVYDHPHTYSITAYAVDRDGEADTTRARVSPICVRDDGGTC